MKCFNYADGTIESVCLQNNNPSSGWQFFYVTDGAGSNVCFSATSRGMMSWWYARDACRTLGSDIATFHSQTIYDNLKMKMAALFGTPQSIKFYVGATRTNNVWTTGTASVNNLMTSCLALHSSFTLVNYCVICATLTSIYNNGSVNLSKHALYNLHE